MSCAAVVFIAIPRASTFWALFVLRVFHARFFGLFFSVAACLRPNKALETIGVGRFIFIHKRFLVAGHRRSPMSQLGMLGEQALACLTFDAFKSLVIVFLVNFAGCQRVADVVAGDGDAATAHVSV